MREIEVDYEIDHSKCEKCKERPCLKSCPVDALHEIPPDHHIEIDAKCIGCVLCREACPYDAINIQTTLSEPILENVPNINPKLCIRCGSCVDACKTGAIQLIASGGEEAHSVIDEEKCVRCGYCARVCPTEAIKYGEILPRAVATGKAMVVDQDACIGCMTCTRVCPSKGAINVGKVNNLPYIDPSYCARCEECMDVCPSTAIRYSSRKRAYERFNKIKTIELVSEILEKETERLANDAAKINAILDKIASDISIQHDEDQFEIDVTDRIKDEIKRIVDRDFEIGDISEITRNTTKREIMVLDEKCIGCDICTGECPVECIELEMPAPIHIGDGCVYCGMCVEACPSDAILLKEELFDTKNGKIFFIRRVLVEKRSGTVIPDHEICQSCGVCVNKCPTDALSLEDDKIIVDNKKCILCGECEAICPVDAIRLKLNKTIFQNNALKKD